MSTLLAYGPDLYSLAVSGWLSVGTSVTGTVPGVTPAHTDGVLGIYSQANEITAAFAVDLGSAKTPLFAAFFNHNITTGIVKVQASNAVDFSALIVDLTVTAAPLRFWQDLRAVTPRTARYWRALVTGNAAAVRLGEFVVADADVLQSYQWGYIDGADYAERVRGATPFGVLHRVKQGIKIRRRQVRWVGPDTVAAALQAVSDYVGVRPSPVICIPDDTATDIWFLDWPDMFKATQILDNRQSVELLLQEQSAGAT